MLPGIQLQKPHMAFYLLLPKEGSLFIGLDLRLAFLVKPSMGKGALRSFPLVVIPISLHGENQSETLAGSCPFCDAHPTLV
jgi:hypothetical protein